MSSYVFIGGVGRSGTSIMRKLLSVNEQVAALPFEYRFIIDPDGIVDYLVASANSWSPYAADKRLKRLEGLLLRLGSRRKFSYFLGELVRSSYYLKRNFSVDSYHGWQLEAHFPNYYKHVNALISDLETFQFPAIWAGSDSFKYRHKITYSSPKQEDELYLIFRSFLSALFHDFLEERGKKILVEDNTWNLLYVEPLSRLFPSSKFIHVYRDPRDVVCSYCNQRWMPSDLVQSAIICRDLYSQIFNNLAGRDVSKIFEISLEELISDQDAKVHLLGSFTGMGTSKSMLEFPLSGRSVGRWKKELSQQQLLQIRPILKEVTEKLGYEW